MQLSLEQMSILIHADGRTLSEISSLAVNSFNSPSFDNPVARKTTGNLLKIGLLRKEEGLLYLSNSGKRALASSVDSMSKVASMAGRTKARLQLY
ncbi:MAG: hypothetical protein EB120_09490 [Proteobacteria bacterium]|nr:hypothetical protein [Pseudomonadota bacterium]NDG27393.1 hypothetical protein [Pseudomonadota bacterium]